MRIKRTDHLKIVLGGAMVALLGLLLIAGCGGKDGVKTAAELTGMDKIVAQYIEATGGRDAYLGHENMKITGTFSMPAMGISAPLEVYQALGCKTSTKITSNAIGTIERGSNGEVFWEKSMMNGARIIEGEERAAELRGADFRAWLDWRKYYTSAEIVGQEEVDGVLCDKVVAVPKEGKPETSWFDAETHLIVKTSSTLSSEMGEISIEAYPSDYRMADDILVPFKVRQVVMGVQEMVIQTDTLTWDVEIPEGLFDLPEDIKALVK